MKIAPHPSPKPIFLPLHICVLVGVLPCAVCLINVVIVSVKERERARLAVGQERGV
jgi:hypothetical protein